MIKIKKFTDKGETIVEVMIAIAIIASAMGIAFATASRSAKLVQANKDRYQAQLYANQQADFLLAKSNDAAIRDHDHNFCFSSVGVKVQFVSPGTVPTECIRDDSYNITIIAKNPCNNKTYCIYDVRVNWDSATGKSDSVEIFYGT